MTEGFIYLLLTIVATTLMMTGVKEAQRRGCNLLQATSFNYYTCVGLGLIFSPHAFENVFFIHREVVPLVLFLGSSFIFIFLVMGWVTELAGIAYMAFISKIALVISVIFSWGYFGDPLTPLKIAGILLALVSIVLINSGKSGKNSTGNGKKTGSLVLLSVILFLGSGVNDSVFKIFSAKFSSTVSDADFAICVFFTAGTLGFIGVFINAFRGIAPVKFKNVLGGIAIGLPNYFSLVFLTTGLQKLDGTVFFPVNNIGILLLAGLIGLAFYREKVSRINVAGMGIAILAIILMVI